MTSPTSPPRTTYLDSLLTTDKYARQNQLRLEARVFRTFDALLRVSGSEGHVAGRSLLDLGSADGALIKVVREHGLTARGLDVTDGVNFETGALPVPTASVDV